MTRPTECARCRKARPKHARWCFVETQTGAASFCENCAPAWWRADRARRMTTRRQRLQANKIADAKAELARRIADRARRGERMAT